MEHDRRLREQTSLKKGALHDEPSPSGLGGINALVGGSGREVTTKPGLIALLRAREGISVRWSDVAPSEESLFR